MNPMPGPDLVMLWINPSDSDYFDLNNRTSSADVFRDDFVAFDAATLAIFSNLSGIRFDNILISNTAGGVGLRTSAVPEPAGAGVMLMILVAGLSACRRLRVAKPAAVR
jgi:hypothetical protein